MIPTTCDISSSLHISKSIWRGPSEDCWDKEKLYYFPTYLACKAHAYNYALKCCHALVFFPALGSSYEKLLCSIKLLPE